MGTTDKSTVVLAELAGKLLGAGPAPAPPPVDSPVVHALEELHQLDSADLEPLAVALVGATLLAPMRTRADGARARRGDASLITLTGSEGERVLPLFTSEQNMRRALRDGTVVGSPLTAKRAFEAAIGLGFDAIELDRGMPYARRVPVSQMRRMLAEQLAPSD